jgi:hypothetical protein
MVGHFVPGSSVKLSQSPQFNPGERRTEKLFRNFWEIFDRLSVVTSVLWRISGGTAGDDFLASRGNGCA